jgi:hypothetical protein
MARWTASRPAALNLGQALGMRPLVALCHLGLATLHRRTGQREQADQHLTTATTMYRGMGMRVWLDPAEAEGKELESGTGADGPASAAG